MVLIDPDHRQAALLPSSKYSSLREALDDWHVVEPELREIDEQLRSGRWNETVDLSECRILAPLPRTWAMVDGSAFVQHVLLVRKARGAEPPEDLLTIPLMYQGASDNLLAYDEPVPLLDQRHGMDFESEVAVITDAVPCGTTASAAHRHIKLLMLMNDVSLRELIPRELATGFGFYHSKPPSSFSPFAVTPDELELSWRDGRVHLPLVTRLNGVVFGKPNAGEMHFSFGQLIEHASKTRPLSAGTIVGSGTVSNKDERTGSSCIVERRMIEKIETGSITTQYLKSGDHVEISMFDGGRNIFGSISQHISQIAQ